MFRLWRFTMAKTKKLKSDINNVSEKLKSVGGPLTKHGFWLEAVYLDEGEISILFSLDNDKNDLTVISIDSAVHFQRTDESYKIETFNEMVVSTCDNPNPLFANGERFFEVLDKKYTEWVLKDHYFPLDDACKMYVLFFADSYIEILSYSPPIFHKISSRKEFHNSLGSRICL